MRISLKVIAISLVTLFVSNSLQAQMFSVGDDRQQRTASSNFIFIGAGNAEFIYSNIPNPALAGRLLNFEDNYVRLAFESEGIDAQVNMANKLTGAKGGTYVDLALQFNPGGIILVRRSGLEISIPLQINTQLTSVNRDNIQDSFRQTSFGLGAGGKLGLGFGKRVILTNQFIPGYGFSSTSGGFVGGSVFFMNGKSRLVIENLFPGRSLSIGYNFGFQRFDLDDNNFDYELTSNSVSIGVSF